MNAQLPIPKGQAGRDRSSAWELGVGSFLEVGSWELGVGRWDVRYCSPPRTDVIYTTPSRSLATRCHNPGGAIQVFYSYVVNGVTETSAATSLWCNPGQWS